MSKQYAARTAPRKRPNKLTSISAWHDLARNRLAYLLFAALFGFGLIAYFGTTGTGGNGGSGGAGSGGNDAIAVVNGVPIKRGIIEQQFDQARQFSGGDVDRTVQFEGMGLNSAIDQALMTAEAKRRGLKVSDADVDKGIAQIKAQMGQAQGGKPVTDDQFRQALSDQGKTVDQVRDELREELLPQVLRDSISGSQRVTQDDLLKSYDEIKARHILIGTTDSKSPVPGALPDAQARNRAEQILAKIKAGGDFAQLANQYSMDPSNKGAHFDPKTKKMVNSPKGGALGDPSQNDGWYKRGGGFVSEFEDAAFALKPGQVSDVVKTPFGYHIIKVDAYRRDLPKDFDKNRATLLQDLKGQRAQKPISDLMDQLRKTARIDWKDPSMKWRYDYNKISPGFGMTASMPASPADQQAFTTELQTYVAKHPDDSAADVILGNRLYQAYMLSGIPMGGKKPATAAEREVLRNQVIATFSTALQHTEDRNVRFNLAELYTEAKDNEKALAEYKKLSDYAKFDTSSQDVATHTRLAAAFKKLGDNADADKEQKIVAQITAKEAADRKAAADAAKAAEQAKKAAAAKPTAPAAASSTAPSVNGAPAPGARGATAAAPGAKGSPAPQPTGSASPPSH